MSSRQREAIALAAAVCGGALLHMLARHRRRFDVIDVATASNFAARAYKQLRDQGYARLKLTTADAAVVQRMFADADSFFSDREAVRWAHVPPNDRARHDSRSGYAIEKGREFFEVHPRAAQATKAIRTAALQPSVEHFCAMCHRHCMSVLREMAPSNRAVAAVLDAEEGDATTTDTPRRPPPPPPSSASAVAAQSFSASMVRVHLYVEDVEHPPHKDLGLLTLAPRASAPGLVVRCAQPQATAFSRRALRPALTLRMILAATDCILSGTSATAFLCAPLLRHVTRHTPTRGVRCAHVTHTPPRAMPHCVVVAALLLLSLCCCCPSAAGARPADRRVATHRGEHGRRRGHPLWWFHAR